MFGYIRKIKSILSAIANFDRRIGAIEEALGRIESGQDSIENSACLNDHEFKVYSQWGEDGIIDYLIRNVEIENNIFVEFGVGNYLESNTRYLLINKNWSGLVIDGDSKNISFIKSDPIYWRQDLKADCAFITKDNINELLEKHAIMGDIGLLSIDIDGNDYWVWKEIDVISPRIVVIEYNYRFGADNAVTIPYDPHFVRQKAHYSMIYFGASLPALVSLGKKKGYSFIGCNSNGLNAFFVRTDVLGDLRVMTAEGGYVKGKFREARNRDGHLSFMSFKEEQSILIGLPVVNVAE
jgi:hypothetical protein